MKKIIVLLGSVLVAGCFICHKTQPQKKPEVQRIVEQRVPVPEEKVITRHSIVEAANFNFNSSEIRSDMNKMDELEKDIKANPDAIILVEGHTDNIGTEEYNKELSFDRAKAVAAVLAKQGYPNQIRVYGAGSSNPIASNETAAGRAQNRRVDVVLVRE
ncbi:MAG: OmpA family protein [Elusimicrobiaceae bacterium]|nr:OmpA family protein [Elusimicrobiaceae bacterium]